MRHDGVVAYDPALRAPLSHFSNGLTRFLTRARLLFLPPCAARDDGRREPASREKNVGLLVRC